MKILQKLLIFSGFIDFTVAEAKKLAINGCILQKRNETMKKD